MLEILDSRITTVDNKTKHPLLDNRVFNKGGAGPGAGPPEAEPGTTTPPTTPEAGAEVGAEAEAEAGAADPGAALPPPPRDARHCSKCSTCWQICSNRLHSICEKNY